ncbi:hypothetical protein H112_07129 [Trichophyton rubrum D6]|uniref:Uncharacterized protein n=3 Tax=Trichophyton rubrum TaxID=5551 RepID=A0A178F088_TRIRU|nr:uncharacterized protein TERG_02464 [Trichophyton rubrum CBS 118892]EZF11596.1 hypothetical protein H100_07154 [Trichophyton rubrum MR850]EZF38633.1 hypothetical protein H102_07114 [Trichophyton rubrum CBS 100081]EZF49341.1 hypothetical protein H103_07137 [Trichophyton rubrum CBS 288.86]EZF59885.1 hypothetical protein H104_07091 [Trichophyton rubrum CBS 289.86]EZF81233.1 hypothetical protein H110_07137 [Trichophyton rubrum MR1448]EZF91693.1 hypothetical protein H113_07190 [Trichophyton rubr
MGDRLHYLRWKPTITAPSPNNPSNNARLRQQVPVSSPSTSATSGLQGQGTARYVRGSYTLFSGYNIDQINGILVSDDGNGFLLAVPPEASLRSTAPEAGSSSARRETRPTGHSSRISDYEIAKEEQDFEDAIQNSLKDHRTPVAVPRVRGQRSSTVADRPSAASHRPQQPFNIQTLWRLYQEQQETSAARQQPAPAIRRGLLRPSAHKITCTICSGSRAVRRDEAIADGLPICESCCDEILRAEQSRAEQVERERRVRFA